MSPPLEPTTPRAALHALFIELFTAQELRWWLRSGEDANIIAELPEEGPLAALAERALTALESRGQIDTGFFARLAAERPGKKAAIAAVAEHWCAIEPATTPRPRAKSSLIKSRRETPYPPEQKRHEIVLRGERRADVIRWGLHVHGEAKAEASFDVAGSRLHCTRRQAGSGRRRRPWRQRWARRWGACSSAMRAIPAFSGRCGGSSGGRKMPRILSCGPPTRRCERRCRRGSRAPWLALAPRGA